MARQTVIVAFDVDADTTDEAEGIVDARLERARLLWHNDSNDIANGTLDPILTYAVVPLASIFEASL